MDDSIVIGDTVTYRFDIPCQLGEEYKNRIMPLEYKAVVVKDSLIDILRHWDLFNNWISEFPEVFNPKDLKYWYEIDDSISFKSITSNYVELIEISSYEEPEWIEFYVGNVEIETLNGVLYCDSAKWRPMQGLLEVPAYGRLVEFDENSDTVQILIGDDWVFQANEFAYMVHGPIGSVKSNK